MEKPAIFFWKLSIMSYIDSLMGLVNSNNYSFEGWLEINMFILIYVHNSIS